MSEPTRLAERKRIEKAVLDLVASGVPADRAVLQERAPADLALFNSAVQSLVARKLLPEHLGPEWPSKQARAIESQILALVRARHVIDQESILLDVQAEDPALIARAIDTLIRDGSLVETSRKCYPPPTSDDIAEVLASLPATTFEKSFFATSSRIRDFATSIGEAAESVIDPFCQALQKQGALTTLRDGAYCASKYLRTAENRLRQQLGEYRTYSREELIPGPETDPGVFSAAVQHFVDTGLLRKVDNGLHPTPQLRSSRWRCTKCGNKTTRIDVFDDVPMCMACTRSAPERVCITKTRATKEYRLKPHELDRLQCLERPNPHYKTASPMQLYLLDQVRDLSRIKWGGTEPYIVALTEFSEQQKLWLLEDPDRFRQLSPERFQYFLADRFDAMGLCVQLTGNVYRSDGGIDLIAYPDPSKCAFPFLVAIQAAHHNTVRKSGVGKVRDFVGAFSGDAMPFRIGVIATNTAFTWDAQEYGKAREHILRLRDLQDLIRWLRNDFVNEFEWRELPDEVQFGRYRVPLLKPKPYVGPVKC